MIKSVFLGNLESIMSSWNLFLLFNHSHAKHLKNTGIVDVPSGGPFINNVQSSLKSMQYEENTPSTEIKGHIKGPNLCELRLWIGCEPNYSSMYQEILAVVGLTENLG